LELPFFIDNFLFLFLNTGCEAALVPCALRPAPGCKAALTPFPRFMIEDFGGNNEYPT
jgi:hypothetical protein